MRTLIMLCLMLSQTALSMAQTVYTWTDDMGVVHFSDTPISNDAKKIEMPDYRDSAPAPQFEQPKPPEPPSASEPTIEPLTISIIAPLHDQTIRSNAGMLTIRATLNRKLAVDERLQLVMDGTPHSAPKVQPLWELRNLDRGTHTFIIQAHRDGKLIASSNPISVHLLRASQKKVPSPVKPK